MGKKFPEIEGKQIQFIKQQHMFFVGSATANSRINLSPKGMDSFRVIDKNRIVWLNVTGSGNETAAHMQSDNRMTIMFCAFEGDPKILRLYGTAKTVHIDDEAWHDLYALFKPLPGARQIFDMHVDLVHTSCGFGVPLYDFAGDRDMLNTWAVKKEARGMSDYWQKKNSVSLDGEVIYIPEEKE
ncbi:MAG: pyridoxamine 5'-phosphate oxidase family protein [Mariprofundaceae bacterium]